MKKIWKTGLPEEAGIYWYYPNLTAKHKAIFVARVYNEQDIHLFGDNGSIEYTIDKLKKSHPKSQYAYIEISDSWQDISSITGSRNRAWVKHPKGYVGLGLLNEGSHDNVNGTVIWLDHPDDDFEFNKVIQKSDNFKFIPLKAPIK